MIVDHILNISHYDFPHKAVVENFLSAEDVTTISVGRHDLTDGVFVNVCEYEPGDNERFEAHRRYIDLQLLVFGDEQIGYASRINGKETETYDTERDVAFYVCPAESTTTVRLQEAMFALFYPWDLHAPSHRLEADCVRKLIFKLPVED